MVAEVNPVPATIDHPSAAGPTLSSAALERVRALIHAAGNPALKLRVSVEGGGCSGFKYGFGLDAEPTVDDCVLARADVALLVDRQSLPYLEGAEVDYVDELAGAQFVVHNPNAKATCGCGSSFAA